jgi:hypothetical protein
MKYFLIIILTISIAVPCNTSSSIITQQDVSNPKQNIQVERWNIFQLKLDGPQEAEYKYKFLKME